MCIWLSTVYYGRAHTTSPAERVRNGQTHFMSILRGVGLVVAIISSSPFAFGGQQTTSGTYRCAAKDAVTLQHNGVLGRDGDSESQRKFWDGVIVDTRTGAMTLLDSGRIIWSIVQRGSDAYDHVLVPKTDSVGGRAEAKAATDFFRLRAWSSQVTFIAFNLSTLVSGTCEIVR
jgi:hypothetical protein